MINRDEWCEELICDICGKNKIIGKNRYTTEFQNRVILEHCDSSIQDTVITFEEICETCYSKVYGYILNLKGGEKNVKE